MTTFCSDLPEKKKKLKKSPCYTLQAKQFASLQIWKHEYCWQNVDFMSATSLKDADFTKKNGKMFLSHQCTTTKMLILLKIQTNAVFTRMHDLGDFYFT